MLDISTLAVKETTLIEINGPDGEPLVDEAGNRVSITVYGPGSKPYQRAQGVRNRAILEAVRRGAKKMNDAEQREVDADFLASCTAAFNNFAYKDLQGPEAFKAAYMDISIGWMAEQVNKAIGDWENFT